MLCLVMRDPYNNMDKSFMPEVFAGNHSHWYSFTLDSLNSVKPNSLSPKLIYTYDNALHGFSTMLSNNELEELRNSPGFLSAYNDRRVTIDTTHTFDFISLNHNSGLWPASEYSKDMIIGVIDTGVWPESKSFNDEGMTDIPSRWKGECEAGDEFDPSFCNKKLIGVRYFNKGLIASNPNVRISVNSGRDWFGHGTHTSSTAGGNYLEGASYFGYVTGTARGIAPRARLAMYKVSWPEGDSMSDVIAGMDRAISDGVDVISISMSYADLLMYEDPIAIASFGAMEKGVLVFCSAGNTQNIGSVHNGFPWVITVAAGTVDRALTGTISLGNGLIITGFTLFPVQALVVDVPLIFNEKLSSCNSTKALSTIEYGIVICKDTGFPSEQMGNISLGNVPGAIFVSDDPDSFRHTDFLYPSVVINSKDALNVIKYAKNDVNPIITMKFQKTLIGTKRAPVVASYTSRGPSPSYARILKPDIMAPGSMILASWVPDTLVAVLGNDIGLASDFAIISGTSMACPHAAGIAALLKGAHPEWGPSAIRSAMITTANHMDNTNDYIRDSYFNYDVATPLAMGAGHVDPNRALDPGLVYDATPQDYVDLLCSTNFTRNQILTITRSGYNCSNPSRDLNYPSFIVLYTNGTAGELVQKFQRTVTNVGDDAASYSVEVVAPEGSMVNVYPKTVVFGKKYERQTYSVTIKSYGSRAGEITFGSITWVEVNKKHRVRSPVVIAPMIHIS